MAATTEPTPVDRLNALQTAERAAWPSLRSVPVGSSPVVAPLRDLPGKPAPSPQLHPPTPENQEKRRFKWSTALDTVPTLDLANAVARPSLDNIPWHTTRCLDKSAGGAGVRTARAG